ncbi:MAG TPA: pitrilysin family protein [bacterium]|nr:pitrilysin family protein [bacterium]
MNYQTTFHKKNNANDTNATRAMRKFFALIPALLLLACVSATADASDARRVVLENGLTVITKEIRTAPIVDFAVWQKVGARNEPEGQTGISHMLEHMAFKGSQKFPEPGDADALIRRLGGSANAGTSSDYTVYYSTMPSGSYEAAIEIEADRMRGLLLREEDFATERDVVVEERKMRYEDSATGLFWEEIDSAAFKIHPYRNPVIGWMADIKAYDIDKIREYYRAMYAPDNAVVVAVGDFDTEAMLKKIRDEFGSIPRVERAPRAVRVEPARNADKRVVVESDKTNLAYVVWAYNAPSITGDDSPALEVAAAALGSGRQSRLYRAFVETGLASSADAVHATYTDPYLFYIEIEAQPGTDTAVIEAELEKIISDISSNPISEYELQKAKNRFAADEIFSNESIPMYGRKLGWFEVASGDFANLDAYMARINDVSAEDVLSATRKYFVKSSRTTGVLLPIKENSGSVETSKRPVRGSSPGRTDVFAYDGGNAFAMKAEHAQSSIVSGRVNFSSSIKKRTLPNGMTIIVRENPAFPTAHIRMVVKGAGSVGDAPGKSGLAKLTARSLRRGTSSRSYEEITSALEFTGAELEIMAGVETAVAIGKFLKADLDTGMSLLADMMISPAFPSDGVEIERAVAISEAEAADNSTRDRAWRAFNEILFAGHPYGNPPEGSPDGLAVASIDDIRSFHSAAYRPDAAMLVVSGDVTIEEIEALAMKKFGSWTAPVSPLWRAPAPAPLASPNRKHSEMPEKVQNVFFMGFPTMLPSHPDYPAYQLMTNILAGGDLTSRLYQSIREKEGLVYYVYGYDAPRAYGSTFQITGGVAPDKLERAIELAAQEIKRIQTEPVSDIELEDAKSHAAGQLPLAIETNDKAARVIADLEYHGKPFDTIDNYASIIDKITPDDIMRVAREGLNSEAAAIGVAGPPISGERF